MNNKKTIYALCLLLLVTVMTIGYALIEGKLNINGSAKITAASWDIYFSKLEVINGEELENDDAKITNKTEVSFNIDLNTPGDYYEFTVDVVNNGTLDAMIDKINITPDISDKPYLSYTVKYLDDSDVEEKDILHLKKARTIKVRVEYLKNIDNNELNKTDNELNIVFSMEYLQADTTGKEPTAADKNACKYEIGEVFEFKYNGTNGIDGSIYEFPIPCDGIYKLEVWGAQGGSTTNYSGGFGGYATGNIILKEDEIVYVGVGGTSPSIAAGYNGGGTALTESRTGYTGKGGGGATHIALNNNLGILKNYLNNQTDVLIIAGGGGGAGQGDISGYGGHGGGYYGVSGTGSYSPGSGASQSGGGGGGAINGSYGQGGTAQIGWGGGGGGGLYGGGGSQYSAAGGGSGYLSSKLLKQVMYCYGCGEYDNSANPTWKTVSTTGSSSLRDTTNCPSGYSGNPISKCAKSGHGYARITYLGY